MAKIAILGFAAGQQLLGAYHLEKNLRQHLRIHQIKTAFQLVHLSNTSVLAENIIASEPLQCKSPDAILSLCPVLSCEVRPVLAGFFSKGVKKYDFCPYSVSSALVSVGMTGWVGTASSVFSAGAAACGAAWE